MSETAIDLDLDQELSNPKLGYADVLAIKKRVYAEKQLSKAEELQKVWAEDKKRIRHSFILDWILNHHAGVVERRPGKDTLLGLLRAKSQLAHGLPQKAADNFRTLAKTQGEAPYCHLGEAEATLAMGQVQAAQKLLGKLSKKYSGEPELHYLMGLAHDRDGDYKAAQAAYEQAIELGPDFAPALFRLAYNHDLRGRDEKALEMYERCAELQPTYVNCLLNLGVLYEDGGDVEKAIQCFRAVLDTNPNHQRARLFLKDAMASLDMYFDEDQARRADRQNLILSIPVTDFELSVRSRNCLNKMNIKTLGDLVEKTEAELLSYKNFGETSLMEIKEILAKKGLKLGMGREAEPAKMRSSVASRLGVDGAEPEVSEAVKALTDFDLSVRVRTALKNLGIETLGGLATRTSRELLACKNFGQTSLDEVRQLLFQYGLSLADEPS